VLSEPSEVVLNFGVIDILQEYNITKKSEHTWKGLFHERASISAVAPDSYAARMKDFLREVFY
jgi:1-phosphatidylinositol-4-phosphate 5-kinase